MMRTLKPIPILLSLLFTLPLSAADPPATPAKDFDLLVLGATPGGITAAIAAARLDRSVALLERTDHLGGLPANGLGATDIGTRGATGGLFLEFVNRVKSYYATIYGPDSQQLRDCSDGYHFEPHVAEMIFETMLAEQPKITILKRRQFDAKPQNVKLDGSRLTRITVTNRESGAAETYAAKCFIDATYEGDLAAAAGAPFTTHREGQADYHEIGAGKIYKPWGGPPSKDSTGEGDDTIQAYNYRLCLTKDPANRFPIAKPANYNRDEYVSLIDDVKNNRWTSASGKPGGEMETNGIGRLVNMVKLPNGKTDANNQHLAFLSTDLPEENYAWPTADWAWRDKFAQRQRDYTLGLLYFAQNDAELPEDFRARCKEWGLAKDEYADNDHFPRQVYVREGRRIQGEHLFSANDALPEKEGGRPPIYRDSITASHYSLDSHAHHKREPGKPQLEGFLSFPTKPYTVPYGVIVPKKVDNLLTPVPVSGTHMGFSTLRMEPCWMALGQAAGIAASLCLRDGTTPRALAVDKLQTDLLRQHAILIYFKDLKPTDPDFPAIQYWALRGLLPEWDAAAAKPIDDATAKAWLEKSGVKDAPAYTPGKTPRGQFLTALYHAAAG